MLPTLKPYLSVLLCINLLCATQPAQAFSWPEWDTKTIIATAIGVGVGIGLLYRLYTYLAKPSERSEQKPAQCVACLAGAPCATHPKLPKNSRRLSLADAVPSVKKHTKPTFSRWYDACKKYQEMPPYEVSETGYIYKYPQNQQPSIVDEITFNEEIDTFMKTMQKELRKPSAWVGTAPTDAFYDLEKHSFKPYAQKLVVPAGSNIAFFGDLHGCVHDVLGSLEELKKDGYLDDNFKVLDKDNYETYIIFLGDYVDRGPYGLEVIYTLLQLKNANPDRVFMVRGNHEDANINIHGGFISELIKKLKLGGSFDVWESKTYKIIEHLYDVLPVVLYLCCPEGEKYNVIQCCHGGMELGYNPKDFLAADSESVKYTMINKLNRTVCCEALSDDLSNAISDYHKKDIAIPTLLDIGFVWNDFIVDCGQKIFEFNYTMVQRASYGKSLTDALLKASSSDKFELRGVFRAHQHRGLMLKYLCDNGGLVQLWRLDLDPVKALPVESVLWDGIVCTFISTRIQPEMGIKHRSYGMLKTAPRFQDWRLIFKKTPVSGVQDSRTDVPDPSLARLGEAR